MAVSAKTEFDVAAPPSVVMEVLLDVESLPEWSGPHKQAEILSTHEDGSPNEVHVVVNAVGVSDEQTLNYSWTENTCTWDLIEAKQLSHQHGVYTVTPNDDGGAHIEFVLDVDLKIKMPGMLVKRGQKMAVDTAKKGLTAESERRAKS
ncbi:SRPBCC family protein [Gordonia sp. CPCC 205515]|uniref:SRPBCC family protein n=1 Tax=Gordonia sp. CPCC 205515 TaxID=3140791 RepID=UPI003AF4022C